MLNKRICLLFVSFICVFGGLVIYLTLRQNTFIHLFIGERLSDKLYIQHSQNNFLFIFLKYYFVDLLWGISLSFALIAVTEIVSFKRIIFCSLFSFIFGLLFEIIQYYDLVNGTFDFIDIFMYLIAALISAVINIIIFKGDKKL